MNPDGQDSKIIKAAQEVFWEGAKEANELAFMSKCFIQATLPHSDPGDVPIWGRKSGNYSLTIQPHYIIDKEGKPKNIGLPYGSIPRLILAWINAEVLKTDSKQISLGKSFSEFVRKLGYSTTGGKKGDLTRIRHQAMRLFTSKISLSYDSDNGFGLEQALLVKKALFFWDIKQPDQPSLWDNEIILSEEFFTVLKNSPVPLDWRVLKAIKQSPMALDLYMWLSHRMFNLTKPQQIKWETLALQFGSEYKSIRHFRSKVREHAKKIQAIWQALNIDLSSDESVIIKPSKLLIAPKGLT